MPKTPEVSTMHQESLDNIADGTVKPYAKPRKKARAGATMVHIIPDPRIWKVALKLAKGNAHRIRVISNESVVVYNNPR